MTNAAADARARDCLAEICAPSLSHPAGGDVDVWVFALPERPAGIASLWPVLGSDERSRAERFRRPTDRNRYVVAHAALRTILARYVEADPAGLRFVFGRHGKPALAREPRWPDVRSNLSHSGGIAACAIALGREVGIDVEELDGARASMAVAARHFSPGELAALQGLGERDRQRGFFNCWTRKEAYIKARGEGLSIPLSQFDVSLAPGEPPALLSSRPHPGDVDRWSLHELALPEGYVGAVAVERAGPARPSSDAGA